MTRTPIETYHDVNGVRLCLFEWPGEGRPILFAHATGFHARCWDQVIAHLPDRRCYALDFRGHGRSAKPEPPYLWQHFANDLAALCEDIGLAGAIGVGHSKGGRAVVQAQARRPESFAALLLVDPVILPREAYAAPSRGSEHYAARRRNEWASPDEMFERFRNRPPFAAWDRAVLRDYCDYGLLPNPAGEGYVLACPPAIEANVYMNAGDEDPYPDVESLDIPVRVLRARARTAEVAVDMSGSPTAPDLVTHLRHGEDVSLPQYSHFIPMEAPVLIAQQVALLEARLNA